MAPEKRPAFQFYPRDFLSDERVRQMSHTERGIYITLLCLCWLETSLPLETDVLAKVVGMPIKRFTALWENSVLRKCFQLEEDGRLHHKRLDEERTKQTKFSRRQTDNANARWQASGNAVALPSQSPREEERRQKIVLSEKGSGEKPAAVDVAERGAALIQHYAAWYSQYRNGARLRLVGSPLEFGDACSLCETWDDQRLEKLAKIVLTTNDDFIAGTDRSFKIFALKASWADDRLRQAESGAA